MKKNDIYKLLIALSFVLFASVLFWIALFNPFNIHINGAIIAISIFVMILILSYLLSKLGL